LATTKPSFGWKELGGNLYQATQDGADLRKLADWVAESKESWQCIWRVNSPDPEKSKKLYKDGKAGCGDIVDASNLTTKGGGEVNVVYVHPTKDLDLMASYTGFSANISGKGENLAEYLRDQAGHGATPIGKLVIASHGREFIVNSINDGMDFPKNGGHGE
jgi:hypothetical protein